MTKISKTEICERALLFWSSEEAGDTINYPHEAAALFALKESEDLIAFIGFIRERAAELWNHPTTRHLYSVASISESLIREIDKIINFDPNSATANGED